MHRLARITLALLAALPLATALPSCDKKAARPGPVSTGQPITKPDIVGEWGVDAVSWRNLASNFVQAALDRADMDMRPEDRDTSIENVMKVLKQVPPKYVFRDDGSMTADAGKYHVAGTWHIKNDFLYLTVDDRDMMYEYTDSTLTTTNEPDGYRTVRLAKKK